MNHDDFWTQVENVLSRSIENSSNSIFDDFIRENAKKRNQVGYSAKIVRKLNGETCDWCKSLVGVYQYGDEPKEVYQRHDRCDCTVEYFCEKGRQKVPTRKGEKKEWLEENDYKERERLASMLVKGTTREEFINKVKKIRKEMNDPFYMMDKDDILKLVKSNGVSYFDGKETRIIRNEILSNTNINDISGKQKIHLNGTKEFYERSMLLSKKGEYGPSYITLSDDEILDIVNKYHGRGVIERDKNGNWRKTEIIVNNEKIIGYVVNNKSGKTVPTSIFKIHYSNEGIHIVPDYPSKSVTAVKKLWNMKK